jgi:hypothetical protein
LAVNLAIVFGGVVIVAWLFGGLKKTPEELAKEQQAQEQAQQKAREQDAHCPTDLQCWGDQNAIYATSRCRDPVERLAKHQAEWTDRWYESKFSRFRWLDRQRGTLTYIGDRIKFQNGFGAWSPMTYTCDFDPATKTVLSVNAWEGRLSE